MAHENKKNEHRHGPHVYDARNPDGSIDTAKLAAGAKAWLQAIENGDVRIVSASQLAVDENNDVLIFVREIVNP